MSGSGIRVLVPGFPRPHGALDWRRSEKESPVDAGTHALGLGAVRLVALTRGPKSDAVRAAAWVAHCVGRGASAPLADSDRVGLAALLEIHRMTPGAVVFAAGAGSNRVWVVRSGRLELAVGSGRRRVVVRVLRPGDADGDIQLLLAMPPPYTARALTDVVLLRVPPHGFEPLLAQYPRLARRWMSSVATWLALSQSRVLELLGRSLAERVARLLLDEALDGSIELPQQTLAAMLGVQRPSLNKALGDLQRAGVMTGYRAIRVIDPVRCVASRADRRTARRPVVARAVPTTGLPTRRYVQHRQGATSAV